MSVLEEWEEEAGENAHRVLTLIEAGRREELTEYIRSLDAGEITLALYSTAVALLAQEAANESMAQSIGNMVEKNRQLEAGNISLFSERRKLRDDIASLQQDRENQAKRLEKYREMLQDAQLLRR